MFKIGYYTYFNLSVENDVSLEKQREAALRLLDILNWDDEEEKRRIAISEFPFDFISYDSMKWYDWESDMDTLAQEFPEIEFVLYGEGEERDDNWRAFFKGDRSVYQHQHTYYDPEPIFGEDDDE